MCEVPLTQLKQQTANSRSLFCCLIHSCLSFRASRGVYGERRGGDPVAGDAAPHHHPVEVVREVPELGGPAAAVAAAAVAALQALAHGGHRLLARPLDLTRHQCQDPSGRTQLHLSTGEGQWGIEKL